MDNGLTIGLLFRFATALAIGLLIGIERGWRARNAPAGTRTAGIRSYALSALIGGIAAEISRLQSAPSFLGIALATFVVTFALFKAREQERDKNYSVTGVLAAFIAFLLGALAVIGDSTIAAAGGVATASLLALRQQLHGWLARLSWIELRSALMLAIMTIIVLPALPNEFQWAGIGIAPRQIWIFTVLTAAISYAGYIAMRLLGSSRGVLLSGIVGAIISSTAVTINFGRRSTESPHSSLFAAGALLAGAISLLRVGGIVLVVGAPVFPWVGAPLLIAATTFCGLGLTLFYIARQQETAEIALGNPFEIKPLFIFAGAYLLVVIAGQLLARRWGEGAIVLTSAISGIFDVDVAVLTALQQLDQNSLHIIATAILLATALNGAARSVCAVAFGSRLFGAFQAGGSIAALMLATTVWWFIK